MGVLKGSAATTQAPVKPARALPLSIPVMRPLLSAVAAAPPVATSGARPALAPSHRGSGNEVMGDDIYRILEDAPGQELTFKEVRSTLGGDRTRVQWAEYIAATVAASEGGLWKDDKRIKLVGSRPVAKPATVAGAASSEESSAAAGAGEGSTASTCKERRKAKRLAEQLEAAEEKKEKKLKKEPQSKTGADGVRYCDRSSFVCAGACGQDLPPSAFKPNQIKKGEGKHRCTACVDAAETAASQAAAVLAEAKQTELKRKRAADSTSLSGGGEVSAKDLWYAQLAPSAGVAAASAATAAATKAKALPMRPEVALLRLKRTKLLRSQFARSLKEHHATRTPLMAFERWLARSKMHETHPAFDDGTADSDATTAGSRKKQDGIFAHVPGTVPAASVGDELLPSDETFTDIGLVRDLLRVGLSEEAAHAVASSLASASKKACEALKEASDIAKREARQRQQQAAWGALEEDETKGGDNEEKPNDDDDDDSSSSTSSSSSDDDDDDDDEAGTQRPAKASASNKPGASSNRSSDSTSSSTSFITCTLAGRATYKLAMGAVKPYLEVKQAHLAKLAMLHERTSANGGTSSATKKSADVSTESAEAILERLLAIDSEAAATAKDSADPIDAMATRAPFLLRVFALLCG